MRLFNTFTLGSTVSYRSPIDVQDFGKVTDHYEEFRKYTLIRSRKTKRCEHLTGLTWKY